MKKNDTLFIDTTNNFCYLAVGNNEKIVKEIKLPVNKNVTDIIVASIYQVLNSAKAKPHDIKTLVVNIGPGSFTGDKVGVTVAKAWKIFNKDINIMTIDSLLLQTKKAKPTCISVINAKSNKLYVAVYLEGKELLKPSLINDFDLQKVAKKYSTLPILQDEHDHMYANFLVHVKSFKKVQDIKYLEPLYLKNPV